MDEVINKQERRNEVLGRTRRVTTLLDLPNISM
jgi:hypothetical protein